MEHKGMKRKIFLTSARLFGEKGFAEVSMRDIASAVGIKASSIYNHYASKQMIFEDIVQYYVDVALGFFKQTETLVQTPGYRPRLEDIFYVYDKKETELMRSITRLLYTEQYISPLAADALLGESSQHYNQGARRLFDALYQRGVISSRENAQRYAELLARVGHSFQLEWTHPEFKHPDGDLYDMHLWLFKLILHHEGRLDAYEELTGRSAEA